MTKLGKALFSRTAREFFEARPPAENAAGYAVWLHMVFITANVFATRAPGFDKQRFLLVAGVPPFLAGDGPVRP